MDSINCTDAFAQGMTVVTMRGVPSTSLNIRVEVMREARFAACAAVLTAGDLGEGH